MSDFEHFDLATSSFGFSAMPTDELESTEYTLCTIAVDNSGSICQFAKAINDCMSEIIKACSKNPRADNMMIRVVSFGSFVVEHHGFKPLMNCNPDDYSTFIDGHGGLTSLNDAAINAIESADVYAKQLKDDDFDVNGLVVVITDGCENDSTIKNISKVKDALTAIQMQEQIDGGLHSILIGVEHSGDSSILSELQNWQNEAGFAQYVPLTGVTVNDFAKIAKFISRSISSQSQSLATGGPSQSLSF